MSRETSEPLGPGYRRLFSAATISNLGDGVGAIAYPWLASGLTRSPLLIAAVGIGQTLPWLVFSLPAGVLTDRKDRRKLMTVANAGRAAVAATLATAVVLRGANLPAPDQVADLVESDEVITDPVLFGLMLVAIVLLGIGEVIYDNTAQTIMPSVVSQANLEKANGRLWSAEQAANEFIGQPLGTLLLALAFAAPFYFDAASFAISAVLIWSMRPFIKRRAKQPGAADPSKASTSWLDELKEGFAWLWNHRFFRTLAIVLGLLNLSMIMAVGSTYVLFAQEVLGADTPLKFTILMSAGAAGSIVGGWLADRVTKRTGDGTILIVVLFGSAVLFALVGVSSNWIVVWVLMALSMMLGIMWNVVTVALRQSVIPDELLGRVNSVYRFFAWGMMPIGTFLGGAIASVATGPLGRETALRLPFFVGAAILVALGIYARPRLTNAVIAEVRASA